LARGEIKEEDVIKLRSPNNSSPAPNCIEDNLTEAFEKMSRKRTPFSKVLQNLQNKAKDQAGKNKVKKSSNNRRGKENLKKEQSRTIEKNSRSQTQ